VIRIPSGTRAYWRSTVVLAAYITAHDTAKRSRASDQGGWANNLGSEPTGTPAEWRTVGPLAPGHFRGSAPVLGTQETGLAKRFSHPPQNDSKTAP